MPYVFYLSENEFCFLFFVFVFFLQKTKANFTKEKIPIFRTDGKPAIHVNCGSYMFVISLDVKQIISIHKMLKLLLIYYMFAFCKSCL